MSFAEGKRYDQLAHFPAKNVGARITKDFLRRGVELKHPPFVVDCDDGIQRGIQDRGFAFPGLTQLHLSLLSHEVGALEQPGIPPDQGGKHKHNGQRKQDQSKCAIVESKALSGQ